MQPGFWVCIEMMDAYLDCNASQPYKDQPLAQDWARVAKVTEEAGEAVAELISYTGQNPRKPQRPEAREALLEELADVVLTAIEGIQHFTKDVASTRKVIDDKLQATCRRVHLLPEPTANAPLGAGTAHMGRFARS